MKAMDDKKKLMMLGALAAVLLGVGAFQFIGKGSGETQTAPPTQEETPVAPVASGEDPKAEDGKADDDKQNNLVTGSFPQRDPFKALVLPDQPVQNKPPQLTPATRPTNGRPGGLSGALPPLPVAGNPGSGPIGPLQVTPTGEIAPAEPVFGYKLSGVIVGTRPAAVFVDAKGAQRLVPQGGSLDGETRLLDVDRGGVTLRTGNKTLNLTLGGDR